MINLLNRILFVLTAFVSRGEVSCQDYFDLWERSGANGLHFEIPGGHLIFAIDDESVLLHEVGHAQYKFSFEFAEAVEVYLDNGGSGELNDYISMYFDLGRLNEVYAELYMLNIIGDIPEIFEEFYVR